MFKIGDRVKVNNVSGVWIIIEIYPTSIAYENYTHKLELIELIDVPQKDKRRMLTPEDHLIPYLTESERDKLYAL